MKYTTNILLKVCKYKIINFNEQTGEIKKSYNLSNIFRANILISLFYFIKLIVQQQ